MHDKKSDDIEVPLVEHFHRSMDTEPPPPPQVDPSTLIGEKGAFNTFAYTIVILNVSAIVISGLFVPGAGKFVCLVLLVVLGALYYAARMLKECLMMDAGSAEMRRISDAIREGAEGFLRIQYGTISRLAMVTAGGLFLIYFMRAEMPGQGVGKTTLALLTSMSFLLGAFCSALAGYTGVWVSVRVNVRVAAAAARGSYYGAMVVAFRGGAIPAIVSGALCILGISTLYTIYYVIFVSMYNMNPNVIPVLLAGYGFGCSLVALFMQLGGGTYTKGADVGADLIGKVEVGIPEDDPRNPAVIADLVGDNVGDCAGSMADLFESIAVEIIGTMILGGSLAAESQLANPERFIFFPLVVHACDLIVSSTAVMFVRGDPSSKEWESPLAIMKRAYFVAVFMSVVLFTGITRYFLYSEAHPQAWWHFTLAGMLGMVCAYMLILITQYFTDYAHGPVQSIALASTTGHGTNVIQGMSVGLGSCGPPVILITVVLLSAYYLGANSGLPAHAAGLFATSVATMGMLCTAVFVLAMNNFGPIADNAGGIVEMSEQPESVRAITDRLDAIGNVTKAATKGYAVGGSALACFVMFRAYLDEMSVYANHNFHKVDIAKVEVLIGGLLGIAMVFVFSGWAMSGVGKTAQMVVREVRRQFREKPGIMEGTERPEYDTCVAIVTKAALLEMTKPAALALGTPVAIGFGAKMLGVYTGQPKLAPEVLAAFLMFATLTALLMAIFMDNAGGAWDNAKKYIEAGAHGGKGSDAHKAAVTGDTVGDPCKDTAGPALHMIITTMSTTVLVLGPLFC